MDLLYFSDGDSVDRGYADFMAEVQQKGSFCSLKFSCKTYTPEIYKNKVARKPDGVWKSVLDSDRVQWIVSNIAREEERDRSAIRKEATDILKEMAYKDHMSLVRFFGFSLYHTFNTIYRDGVYYNTGTLDVIRQTMREHPVILMPSHRCYIDFLVISILCVHLDLPLPAIAAGMDFMKMGGVNYILRSSGAFFMRRSFGSDRLYWALFTEYVHTLIINGDRPIEFFIEGTRSRSNKSLNPKLGLFSVVAEPYLKAQIYDVMIVPVSISYDRILEESLYAYELLGVPKPKESTSGLFKAASILNENYGSLHVHFSEPISLRKECQHMNRAVHACYPRYMLRLTTTEQSYLNDLAYKVLKVQQKNMVISTWSLIATLFCQSKNGISFGELVEQLQWLYDITRKCRVKIREPSGNLADVVKQTLLKFTHLVTVVSKNDQDNMVQIKQRSHAELPEKLTSLTPAIRDNAAIHIMLASYRNQLVHVFVNAALVSHALQCSHDLLSHKSEEIDLQCKDVLDDFSFMRRLFGHEFIFAPNQTEGDYIDGIGFLHTAGALHRKAGVLHFNMRGSKLISFLMNLLLPFFTTYTLICQYLCFNHHEIDFKDLISAIQLWLARKVHDDDIMPEILSKDIISNGIHGLAEMGIIVFHKAAGGKHVRIRRSAAQLMNEKLTALMKGKPCNIPKLQSKYSMAKL